MPAPTPSPGAAPALILPNWIKAATRCGFNIQPLLDAQGVRVDGDPSELRIERPQLAGLMEACVAASAGPHFPFVLGETFAFENLPDIETYLASSPTLRDAMRVFDWVQRLINPMIRARLDESPGAAALVLDTTVGDQRRRYMVEATFAATVKFARLLAGEHALPRRLCLDYPAPPYAGRYDDYFRAPVRFEAGQNVLFFDARMLDRPLRGGFPQVHEQARLRVEQRLAEMRRRQGVARSILGAFRARPQLLAAPLSAMAGELGMHERTLQRRLQSERQRFAELRAQARFEMAASWLRDVRQPIEDIAERLGFSDRRSFTRAFKHWCGATPSEFRRGSGA